MNALSVPLFGDLSDRWGRTRVYATGAVLALIWVFAFFPLLEVRSPLAIAAAIVVALTLHAMMYGPQAAFIAEQFPTRVRYAGSSLAYTFAGIIGGGIAPLIFAALLRWKQSTWALSLYAAAASLAESRTPSWLSASVEDLEIRVVTMPTADEVSLPVNASSVVELLSR